MRQGRSLPERRFAAQTPQHFLRTLPEADEAKSKEVEARFEVIAYEVGLANQTEFFDLNPAVHGPMAELPGPLI
ncbi:MAG: hypothetical protein N4A61_06215 [Pelagimonas sp.]|jgi:hypothetical protein|nr:hypothetical protein [Pelagimonas sp.]